MWENNKSQEGFFFICDDESEGNLLDEISRGIK